MVFSNWVSHRSTRHVRNTGLSPVSTTATFSVVVALQSKRLRSGRAGVVQRVGDDGLVDEHEERQVGQEVQQVQRRKTLQLQPDGRLLLQTDTPGFQLQQELLGADESTLRCG